MRSMPVVRFFSVGLLVWTVLLCGCATLQESEPLTRKTEAPRPEALPKTRPPEKPDWLKYRSLALQYEQSEQLQKAIFMWQVVENLSLGDPEARRKIRELEETCLREGEKHFARALEFRRAGSDMAARKEFLLTLLFDPGHREALAHLRQVGTGTDHLHYEVKEGDTPATVARKIYGDPAMAVVVTYFNGVAGEGTLARGALLQLPVPEREVRTTRTAPDARTKARAAPKTDEPKTYDKASSEQHYVKGVGHYLAQELQEATKEWEEALRLYPDHPNAKRDIQKVRSLLRKGASK